MVLATFIMKNTSDAKIRLTLVDLGILVSSMQPIIMNKGKG